MGKLTPLFLIMTAFFLAALAIGLNYEHLKGQQPSGVVHQIALLGDHAQPNLLTIKTGDSVEFIAQDGVDHRLSDGKVDSGVVKPADRYRVQLKHAGNTTFRDLLHPKIQAEVVVYDPGK